MSGLEKKLTEAQERLEESYAEGRRAEGQLQALQEQLTEGHQHTAQLQADLASRSAQLAAEHQVRLEHLPVACCAKNIHTVSSVLCRCCAHTEPTLHSRSWLLDQPQMVPVAFGTWQPLAV